MTEIRFYHLTLRGVDQALPEILQKAHAAGHRIVVRARDAADAERLNQLLWTWKADSFLPHGTAKDGHAADQPIWLTAGDDNPNNATVLVVTAGQTATDPIAYTLCCDLFDGRDDAQIAAARTRWQHYKDAGHTLTYWQQGERGWEQKASSAAG